MTAAERVHVLLRTLPDIRPGIPTWAGENARTGYLATNPDQPALRTLYRQGSYHELERVLGAYERACSNRRPSRALHLAGYYWDRDGSVFTNPNVVEVARQDVTALMAAMLAGRIRVPELFRVMWRDGDRFTAASLDKRTARGRHGNVWAIGRRDDRIRQLVEAGLSQRAIAVEVGLSEAQVSRILARAA